MFLSAFRSFEAMYFHSLQDTGSDLWSTHKEHISILLKAPGVEQWWRNNPLAFSRGFSEIGHSITYRVALGPHQGRKAFTLQTVPAATDAIDGKLARAAGFSLHAGVACEAHEREKLERLCRYITRPAVSTERLSRAPRGDFRYHLKTPYRDGATNVVFELLDFVAGQGALVPMLRVNLTRYRNAFTPYHRLHELARTCDRFREAYALVSWDRCGSKVGIDGKEPPRRIQASPPIDSHRPRWTFVMVACPLFLNGSILS